MSAKTKKASKTFDVLDFTLVLYYCPGLGAPELFTKLCKKNKLIRSYEEELSSQHYVAVYLPDAAQRSGYLLLQDNLSIETIHHEVSHVTFSAFELLATQLTADTDELYASHSEEIFRWVLHVISTKFNMPLSNVAFL